MSGRNASSEAQNKQLQHLGCDLMGLQAKTGQALTLAKPQTRLSKDVSDHYFSGYKRHLTLVTQKSVVYY